MTQRAKFNGFVLAVQKHGFQWKFDIHDPEHPDSFAHGILRTEAEAKEAAIHAAQYQGSCLGRVAHPEDVMWIPVEEG